VGRAARKCRAGSLGRRADGWQTAVHRTSKLPRGTCMPHAPFEPGPGLRKSGRSARCGTSARRHARGFRPHDCVRRKSVRFRDRPDDAGSPGKRKREDGRDVLDRRHVFGAGSGPYRAAGRALNGSRAGGAVAATGVRRFLVGDRLHGHRPAGHRADERGRGRHAGARGDNADNECEKRAQSANHCQKCITEQASPNPAKNPARR
jgi:hypothetical protein